MENPKIIYIKDRKPLQAVVALNRLTSLNWTSYPVSLLPKGLVLNGVRDCGVPECVIS